MAAPNTKTATDGKQLCAIEPTSIHEVIWSFLKDESNDPKKTKDIDHNLGPNRNKYLNQPDFTNPKENIARDRALASFRRHLWEQIPRDATYFKWSNVALTKSLFDTYIRRGWEFQFPKQKTGDSLNLNGLIYLTSVNPYNKSVDEWMASLPTKDLFVLEGNHRLSQWIGNEYPNTNQSYCYVIHCPTPCHWTDPEHVPLRLEFHHNQTYFAHATAALVVKTNNAQSSIVKTDK